MGHGLRKVPWLERYWKERLEDMLRHRAVLIEAGWGEDRSGRKFIGALTSAVRLYRSLSKKQQKMVLREERKRR